MSRVDQEIELAAFIREIDGNNDMGACKLAERILEWQAARQQAVPSGYVMVPVETLKRASSLLRDASHPPSGCEDFDDWIVQGDKMADHLAMLAAAPQAEQCDTCHGQGEVWTGQMQSFGQMSMQPPEPIMEECPECGGEEPETEQSTVPVGYTTPGMLQIASGLKHGARIGVKTNPDERYSVPLYTAACIARSDAETFIAEYHAAVWSAAENEDSKVAYDEAGRELAKAFLARFTAPPAPDVSGLAKAADALSYAIVHELTDKQYAKIAKPFADLQDQLAAHQNREG